jgi:hypothetical protein
MATMNTILQLSDANGTSITLKGTPYEEVVAEFHRAWAEQRLMNVGMERPGYMHRVNPQQVVFIQQLEY